MKISKKQYLAPTVEVIEMEVETAIMSVSQQQDVEIDDKPQTGGGGDIWGN